MVVLQGQAAEEYITAVRTEAAEVIAVVTNLAEWGQEEVWDAAQEELDVARAMTPLAFCHM